MSEPASTSHSPTHKGKPDVDDTAPDATDVDDIDAPEAQPAAVPLTEPRDGVPAPVTTPEQLARVVEAFAAGDGPVAVDAERASGYRYGQRAYLVQLRRVGAGTALIDPAALPDLSALGAALQDAEWVLHAASQDLPCLAEVGMRPDRLFDTELAGRLLGHPRVGLGAITESVLGLTLEKGHSAADWSTRPLPEPWLRYAALDVEVLIELRDALHAQLVDQGKLAWAQEEFAAIAAAPPPAPRIDAWRRTSGLHRVRKRRQLAVVRALWEARDQQARRRDIAPGRILPDTAVVEAALRSPATEEELVALPVFGGRANRRAAATWLAAIQAGTDVPDDDLPAFALAVDGTPPARSWADRDPAAAARLAAARAALAGLAEQHRIPTENMISPDAVRRLMWEPPTPSDPATVAAVLRAAGARAWQVTLTAEPLSDVLRSVPTEAAPPEDGTAAPGVDGAPPVPDDRSA